MDQQAEKKEERVIGLGKRTREEIVKWNQMTALRFQARGRHQTSPASLWRQKAEEKSLKHTATITVQIHVKMIDVCDERCSKLLV